MYGEAIMSGGSDWYNVILLTTAPGAAITITDGDEEVEATGTGSEQAIAVHNESATYTISVTANGLTKTGTSVTTGTTSGAIFTRSVSFAHVELTFDNDFRGETGTISDGTTTASYTFPNSGNTDDIYIPTPGTWKVYCTVSSEPFESDPIIVPDPVDPATTIPAEIHVRPDGKTVTPTDDIQLWLQCAGLKTLPYTTLEEVLEDHETLQKLISDHNAVDYMVRSKTWVKQVTVPTMTDDTHPSGKVTTSSVYSSSTHPGWKAFNPSETNGWICASGSTLPQWIDYEFDTPVCIRTVDIKQVDVSTNTRTFDIVAYDNDPNNAVVLKSDVVVGTSLLGIDIENTNLYKHYRVIYKSTTASSVTYGSGIKLQFYTALGITDDPTAMRYIGKRNYAADTLLADSNPGLVPVMTGPTTPEGEASASSSTAASPAWKAFNPSEANGWWSSVSPWCSVGDWVEYDFANPTEVKYASLMINPVNNVACNVSGKFQAYNGSTWIDISDVFQESTNGQEEIPTYVPINTNGNKYTKYRWICTTTISSGTFEGLKIQYYGKDEDPRDPYWLDAICNSEYFESVFNVSPPVMTSDSTPEGLCFSSSNYNAYYQAFQAFGPGANDMNWSPSGGTNEYVGYKFPTAKVIKCAHFYFDALSRATSLSIEASNNSTNGTDGDWDVLGEFTPTELDAVYILNNNTAYLWYRVKITGTSIIVRHKDIDGNEDHHFYGREDVDETKLDIITATQDTVYYLNEGTPVSLGTIVDGNVLSVNRSSLPTGEVTFGSTIAKDPDNLTDDFTKKVNIGAWTIEVPLMPDYALYWYGYEDPELEDCTTANGYTTAISSASIATPTKQTNYQSFNPASNKIMGIASKNLKRIYSVNVISDNITSNGSNYGSTGAIFAKVIGGTGASKGYTLFTQSGLHKQTYLETDHDNKYRPAITGYNGSNAKIYGFWMNKPNPASNFFSAPKDTVYYTSGGVDVVVAETDEFGAAVVNFASIPDGVTLYSSIAKDPDNLSNPYSKVYHAPSGGKFYLMPDNTIYWWGYKGDNFIEITSSDGYGYANISSPTYNLNDIRAVSGSSGFSGIGSKTQPSSSQTVNVIRKSDSIASNVGMAVNIYSGKEMRDNQIINHDYQTVINTMERGQCQGGGYICFGSYQTRPGNLYALWIED